MNLKNIQNQTFIELVSVEEKTLRHDGNDVTFHQEADRFLISLDTPIIRIDQYAKATGKGVEISDIKPYSQFQRRYNALSVNAVGAA